MDIQNREPVIFAAGDSLIFRRHLVEFPASAWKIDYVLYKADGSPAGVTFSSEAAGDGSNDHLVTQPEFAKTIEAGEYILAGYVVGLTGNPPERHQIYRSELQLQANLPAGAVVPPEKWFEQQMVELLQASLKRLAAHELEETDVQRVKIVRAKRADVQQQLFMWEEKLNYRKRLAGGRSAQIVPVFQIP